MGKSSIHQYGIWAIFCAVGTAALPGVKVGSSVGFVAPGEAIVEASIAQEATMKLCSVLFGDTGLGQVTAYFPSCCGGPFLKHSSRVVGPVGCWSSLRSCRNTGSVKNGRSWVVSCSPVVNFKLAACSLCFFSHGVPYERMDNEASTAKKPSFSHTDAGEKTT